MNVELWLTRILGHEGGYDNDPKDPGGETKWGISKRSYPGYDIKNLTVERAAEIYRRDFLAPIKAERYSDGVAYQFLDFAVNSSVETAIRKLQNAVWELPGIGSGGGAKIQGATYDPASGKIYYTQDFGTNPQVAVFQISIPGSTSAVSIGGLLKLNGLSKVGN